jgi:hypothetical protein
MNETSFDLDRTVRREILNFQIYLPTYACPSDREMKPSP